MRPYLLRYASLQLRDTAAAEDAVQEALLAALSGEASFAGRSNLRTWLTGILKHKIVDTIRRQSRERPASELESDGDALPERTARVFMMREHLGLETAEICKELAITSTHSWVMLHRARMALRLCLEKNWFAK